MTGRTVLTASWLDLPAHGLRPCLVAGHTFHRVDYEGCDCLRREIPSEHRADWAPGERSFGGSS